MKKKVKYLVSYTAASESDPTIYNGRTFLEGPVNVTEKTILEWEKYLNGIYSGITNHLISGFQALAPAGSDKPVMAKTTHDFVICGNCDSIFPHGANFDTCPNCERDIIWPDDLEVVRDFIIESNIKFFTDKNGLEWKVMRYGDISEGIKVMEDKPIDTTMLPWKGWVSYNDARLYVQKSTTYVSVQWADQNGDTNA